jgi:hypothetical protein
MERHLITVSLYEKLSSTGSLVVGSEGMVLFCGHLEAPISHLWNFSSGVISNILFTLKKYGTFTFINIK